MEIENKVFAELVADAAKERDRGERACVDGFSLGVAWGRLLMLRTIACSAGESGLVDQIDRILDGDEEGGK